MPLYGVSMVRNEADVIEAFVRHNLRALDRLIVVDHGSSDGTREILHALSDEGLPLAVEHDDRDVRRQPETITRLARRAFAEGSNAGAASRRTDCTRSFSRAHSRRHRRQASARAITWS